MLGWSSNRQRLCSQQTNYRYWDGALSVPCCGSMMHLVMLAIDKSSHLHLMSAYFRQKGGISCYLTDVQLSDLFSDRTDIAP